MRDVGSITRYRRRDGSVCYRARTTIDGREVSCGLHDTVEAANEAITRVQRLARRSAAIGLTLEGWGPVWLERRELDATHRAVRQDRSLWRTHVAAAHFYRWPLRRIGRPDVVRWLRQLEETEAMATRTTGRGAARETVLVPTGRKLSRSVIRNALSVLRQALQDALDEGRGGLRANVARDVHVPKRATTVDGWTFLRTDEIRDVFLLPLRPEQRAIFAVAIWGGLRLGEILGLRWCDVHDDHLSVRFSYRGPTKGGKPRMVPLLPRLREELKRWRAARPGVGEALVFPSARTGGMHTKDFDAGWPSVAKKLGRHVRFHDLRHTCASHLVMGSWGVRLTLEQVKTWLGHTTIAVTERYAHLAPESIVETVRKETGR
jgi:integrase